MVVVVQLGLIILIGAHGRLGSVEAGATNEILDGFLPSRNLTSCSPACPSRSFVESGPASRNQPTRMERFLTPLPSLESRNRPIFPPLVSRLQISPAPVTSPGVLSSKVPSSACQTRGVHVPSNDTIILIVHPSLSLSQLPITHSAIAQTELLDGGERYHNTRCIPCTVHSTPYSSAKRSANSHHV